MVLIRPAILPMCLLTVAGCTPFPLAVASQGTCTVRGTVHTHGRAHEDIVMVYVLGDGPAPKAPYQAEAAQKNRDFTTRVLVVSQGADVAFPNRDRENHNLFSRSHQDPFEFPSHAPGASPARAFDAAGTSRVQCNIHADMDLRILVLPNAWAARVDDDDKYVIEGIKAGTRQLEAWSGNHERQRTTLRCEPGETHVWDVDLPKEGSVFVY